MLRRHATEESAVPYLSSDGQVFFASLPDRIHVWRGCSQSRTRGLSWTTDEVVAVGFARGHRGIKIPSPVVAEGWIAKTAIFSVSADRGESEIVLDPARLSQLSSRPLP